MITVDYTSTADVEDPEAPSLYQIEVMEASDTMI